MTTIAHGMHKKNPWVGQCKRQTLDAALGIICRPARRQDFDAVPNGIDPALSQVAGLVQAYYGGSGTTIGPWTYADRTLVR